MNLFADHVAAKARIFAEALAAAKFDSVLISAGELVYPFKDDLDYVFRCCSYFAEWLPVQDLPDSYLLFSPGKRPQVFLPIIDDYWHSAPAPVPQMVRDQFELIGYRDIREVCTALKGLSNLAWLGPVNQTLSTTVAATENPTLLLNFIDYHRAYKTPYEIRCLEEATQVAHRGHRAAECAFHDGRSELEIHLAYLRAAELADEELPYRSIIALNEHASTLHHMVRAKKVPSKHYSFLIDAGAQSGGYACDISRTHVSQGSAHELFVALRDAVQIGQRDLVNRIRIGASFTELHLQAHRKIGETLVEHKLLQCSLDEAVASGATSVFFPHGLGHLLGMQVHEPGGHLVASDGSVSPPPDKHPALRLTRELEASMVFTVEPGLYFIQSLIDAFPVQAILNRHLIDGLMPYGGVRIEDNILLASSGVRNLTREVFK